MKVCPNCNAEYEDEMSFCFRCGEKLHQKVEHIETVVEQDDIGQVYCPYCGHKIDEDADFCSFCGGDIHSQNVNDTVLIRQRKEFVFWSCDNFFSYSGRSGRLNYFLNEFLLVFIHGAVGYILLLNRCSWFTMFLLTALLTIYPRFCIVNRRFHDLNKSVFWSIIYIVLYYFDILLPFGFMNFILFFPYIYLLFFKGTYGPNSYGDEPLY